MRIDTGHRESRLVCVLWLVLAFTAGMVVGSVGTSALMRGVAAEASSPSDLPRPQ